MNQSVLRETTTTVVQPSVSGFRWFVCALLFTATTINYMDRQVLGILVIPLQRELGWTESQYGFIIMGFQVTYAVGLLFCGPVIDRIGTRLGYALAVSISSVAAVAHGFVRSVLGFGGVRLLLGLGEAGNFPGAMKATSEWFPPSERALAVGLFNSGSTVGAIVAPLVVPWIALTFGWRAAFVSIGLAGFVWIPVWLITYRRPPAAFEPARKPEDAVSLGRLFLHRETWVFLVGRMLTEPVWWFFLYWAPKFLNESHGLTLRNVGLPLMVMYAMANVGGLFGGWMSTFLLKHGRSVNAARKLAVLACALLALPVMFAGHVSSTVAVVGILGLAMAAHQGWASNLFAMLADIYGERSVASITGLTGTGAAVAGAFAAAVTGLVLQHFGSYSPIFVWAGLSYLAVLAGIHIFIPNLHRIEL